MVDDSANYQEMEAHFQGSHATDDGSLFSDGAKSAQLTSLPSVGVSTHVLLGAESSSLAKLMVPATPGTVDISSTKSSLSGAGWLKPAYQGDLEPSVMEAKARLQSMLISFKPVPAVASPSI